MTRILAVDLETTGLDAKVDEIIQAAVVEIDEKTGDIVDAWGSLFQPKRRKISPTVSGVTGLIDEDLEGAPDVSILEGALSGASILVAHNAAFDRQWVDGFVPRGTPWICTLRLSKRAHPSAENHKLATMRYTEGLLTLPGYTREYLSQAHSALPDTLVCAGLLQKYMQMAEFDLGRLIKATEDPILLKQMPFGKHRGMTFDTLTDDYLGWAQKQTFDDPDVNFTIQRELQRRGKEVSAPAVRVTT